MPKSKQQKQEISRDLTARFGKAKSVVFTSFTGLGVKDNETLRVALGEKDSEYYAAKKTLLKRALTELNIEGSENAQLDGQVAVTFAYGDEVSAAKVIADFKKKNEGKVEFLGGILEHRYIDASAVTALATLPSKQELYAQILGSINAPVSGFVNVLAGNLRSLVRVLSAIQETK
ncbi:MAG TPA: 50S ribosomal protein L10 [bacterium]|nr:50S ribosomal protein L10 [bacterium]